VLLRPVIHRASLEQRRFASRAFRALHLPSGVETAETTNPEDHHRRLFTFRWLRSSFASNSFILGLISVHNRPDSFLIAAASLFRSGFLLERLGVALVSCDCILPFMVRIPAAIGRIAGPAMPLALDQAFVAV